jgi:site-specific DNA-methyltransferase (adenine-specific)
MKIDTDTVTTCYDTPIAGMRSYMQPSISLYNEDCLETMRRIPDGSVDLMLTDPPYGTTEIIWDKHINIAEMWLEWERILKPSGAWIFTCSQPFTSELILSRRGFFKYELIWDKTFGRQPQLANIQPMKRHENIVVFGRGKITYNPQLVKLIRPYKSKGASNNAGGNNDHKLGLKKVEKEYTHSTPDSILQIEPPGNGVNIHPTQKPIDLFRWLIKSYSNEGEIIFDGYSGSGTTAHACLVECRKFVGSELDENYFKKSVERLKGFNPQLF